MEYTFGNKYLIISRNKIQSRKYMVNKITIGTLDSETKKTLIFKTESGIKRIRKYTIAKMIDLSCITMVNELFLIERIEGALV